MKFLKYLFPGLVVLWLASFGTAQKLSREEIVKAIDKDGCVIAEEGKVKVCRFDYKYKNQTVEALIFSPTTEGKVPGLMLIPGYQGTAQIYMSLGMIFTKLGFAAMTISTPGFGKTELKPDFLGENTIDAYIEGYRKFEKEPFIDNNKMGIFGYSRGAIAVSLMITKLKDVKAAVLGGGIYDLKKAYDELTIEGIKENIKSEAGLSEQALKERSSIFQMKNVTCPIFIAHGEKDINAPTDQAYLLRDELKRLNKEVEFQMFAGKDHQIGSDLYPPVIDFFSRKLKGQPLVVKVH